MNKNMFLMLGVSLFLMSAAASADQSTDEISGPVTCSAGDDLTVTINQARTSFVVIDGSGESTKYKVTNKDGGDVSTQYTAKASSGKLATLDFDDQGDQISFKGGDTLKMSNCHKGNK